MTHLALIFFGCGLGGILRFWVSNLSYYLFGRNFPYGTLIVNVIGSLIMGVLFILLLERLGHVSQYLRSLLLIGLLGGFTTFSSFSIEVLNLFEAGKITSAVEYIIFSVVFSIIATWIGIIIGRQL